ASTSAKSSRHCSHRAEASALLKLSQSARLSSAMSRSLQMSSDSGTSRSGSCFASTRSINWTIRAPTTSISGNGLSHQSGQNGRRVVREHTVSEHLVAGMRLRDSPCQQAILRREGAGPEYMQIVPQRNLWIIFQTVQQVTLLQTGEKFCRCFAGEHAHGRQQV